MTKKDQREELDELKTRVHALERTVAVAIDVLKDEMERTDAYGLIKKLKKTLALPAMKKALDDAKEWIGPGEGEYEKALDDAKKWDQRRKK
jgi:hypothetical protein